MAKETKSKKRAKKNKANSPKSKVHKLKTKNSKKEESKKAESCQKLVKKSPARQRTDDTIFIVAGESGVRVVNFLGDKKNVSEFVIADKLKLDMQTIRNTLYKLHTHNIASYIRKKDRQKGWYISYWTFNKKRIKEIIVNMRNMHLEKLRERLEKEEANKGVFFICPKACARLDFDQATEFEYKCPECGTLLHQQENLRTIEHLKEKIKEIECCS
ncbi:MAG: hypothetical protein KAK00_10670 [Nanoarchaeota archaeon]|nr:hypothetical protein [Nanoarchaeota archaeon]